MRIIDRISSTYAKLSDLPLLELNPLAATSPAKTEEVAALERTIGVQLPKSLKDFYLNEAASVSLKWTAPKELFGEKCTWGTLILLSPKEVLEMRDEMIDMVEEGKRDLDDLENNAGLRALVQDWGYWIPIFSFPNDDAFCLETRSEALPVVFLEHDVMDGGPYIHGVKIAESFDELMQNWARLSFVDFYDWSQCVIDNGVDVYHPVFDKIREQLKEKE